MSAEKPCEVQPGDRVLEVIRINGEKRLVRVINRGGYCYSLLFDRDGFEIASTPTIAESNMLRNFGIRRKV